MAANTRNRPLVRVGITLGDPAGIGPEITLKAIRKFRDKASIVVIGDAWLWSKIGGLTAGGGIRFVDLANIDKKRFRFGKVDAACGRASIEYLDRALGLIKSKEIDCLVTCPISKEAIKRAGFNFSGHTEYLAHAAHTKGPVMMLLNQALKFTLVTRHIPLKDVARKLDPGELRKSILLTGQALKSLFGVKRPRIVVAGLNPHASDNGVIGDEENSIILPVIKSLGRSILIEGPISADIAIAHASKGKYDCVIVMYHDQALIPLKLLGNDSGVNLTLGLPFVRTSPLHGTAFDIAGRGLARTHSLESAINLAIKCTLNQKEA